MSVLASEIEEAHLAACSSRQDTYIDPQSGYSVFTRDALKRRGKCCGNGCRHCPFGHFNVAPEWRGALTREKITQPTYLRSHKSKLGRMSNEIVVVFWSAGKNSFLTLRRLMNDQSRTSSGNNIVLFTVFNEADELPYQGVKIEQVMGQAKALGVDLLISPQSDPSNEGYLSAVFGGIEELKTVIKANQKRRKLQEASEGASEVEEQEEGTGKLQLSLAFGDVSNDACRTWREEMFAETPYEPIFPLWQTSTKDILQELELEKTSWKVEVVRRTSTSADLDDSVGQTYDDTFVRSLPAGSSEIGEMGEFDTFVTFIKQVQI